ncbi:MAG: hypothetical protein ACRD2L_17485, partial [Terriglobia bacterium]
MRWQSWNTLLNTVLLLVLVGFLVYPRVRSIVWKDSEREFRDADRIESLLLRHEELERAVWELDRQMKTPLRQVDEAYWIMKEALITKEGWPRLEDLLSVADRKPCSSVVPYYEKHRTASRPWPPEVKTAEPVEPGRIFTEFDIAPYRTENRLPEHIQPRKAKTASGYETVTLSADYETVKQACAQVDALLPQAIVAKRKLRAFESA